MTEAVITTARLTKRYGKAVGVSDVDLEVRRGEVFGFLGPNGAGKTTTIRVLLDLIRPTSGSATVLGCDSVRGSREIRRRTGYQPGELSLYRNLTGRDLLEYFGALRGGVDSAHVDELCERLDCDLSRKTSDLSSGNKRKLGLIQALMHRPELLILDEPTSGLDPLVQQEFYKLVGEARAAGQTLFLSSHVLPEVQRVCDRVAFIREGRIVGVEDVAELTGRAVRELEVTFGTPVAPEAFAGVPGVSDVETSDHGLRMTVTGSLDAAVKRLAGFEVVTMTAREPDLEDVFLHFYGGGGGEAADPPTAGPPPGPAAPSKAGDAA